METIWEKLQSLLRNCQRPARYINHEWGSTYKTAEFNFCMAYPDTYELGQSNQAVRILCNVVNKEQGMAAQRCYLPAWDLCDAIRENNIPLFSIEGCNPIRDFDVLGITLPHELCATNICELLDLANIPIFAKERKDSDLFILGGGPCAFNPEPFARFFDAIGIGEGEEMLVEQLQVIRKGKAQGKKRNEILLDLAKIEGTYVPSLYAEITEKEAQVYGSWVKPLSSEVPEKVTKRLYKNFAQSCAFEPCVVPFTEVVHDRLNIEILRGCARGCRFCQAGMMYRPVRERSAENIIKSVEQGLLATGYDEVSLTSLSSTDHSQIKEILKQLNVNYADKGVRVSIPSQRMDSFGVEMAQLVAGRKKGGLTFAPEAGTQRMRNVINKNVTEDDVLNAVRAAFEAGWQRCKLYFMIGLPTENDEDIIGIAQLAEKVLQVAQEVLPEGKKKFVQVGISIAVFVPKAQTPFQWCGQISPEEAYRRVRLIKQSLHHRAITVSYHEPKTSLIEAVMSRGGRNIAEWVYQAWENGARFDAWSELFNKEAWEKAAASVCMEPSAIAQKTYDSSTIMPWEHISCGVSTTFLRKEYALALKETTTPDCTFDSCSNCGVCQSLNTSNCLQAERFSGKSYE